MSGGGTFNSRGDWWALLPPWPTPKYPFIEWRSLPYERLSLFVSINYVRGWLDNAVNQYYGGQNQRLVWQLEGGDELLAQATEPVEP